MNSNREEKIILANQLVAALRAEMDAYNKILRAKKDAELDLFEAEQDPRQKNNVEFMRGLRNKYEFFIRPDTQKNPDNMLREIERKIQQLYALDKEIYGKDTPSPESPSFMRLRA